MFHELILLLGSATAQTLYMVFVAGFIATILGIPLGVLLFMTRKDQFCESPRFYTIISSIVNIGRSIPFIILLVALIPLTRLLVGTSIGTTAAIVPLAVGAIPFMGRMVENALLELPAGLVELGESMGINAIQLVRHILLPEAMPTIINHITVMLVMLVGYSAMAGTVGGGGLGDIAIRYGYQRFDVMMMLYTIILLVLMVQVIQWIGDLIARKWAHR